MQKFFGAKRKERERITQSDRKWWQFLKKSKVKPMRAINIQHHVNFDHYNNNNNNNNGPQFHEMEKYMDQDSNHYRQRRQRKYDDNFIMQNEQTLVDYNAESSRDSLESSEISSDAFSHNFKQRYRQRQQQQQNRINYNNITQHIQNNNNKITIIIKHDNGTDVEQRNVPPQIIYIQPASSQPNLNATNVNRIDNNGVDDDDDGDMLYNSLDDLDTDELYQFYNESPIDVPDDFKRNSYLVLNMNDGGNKKFKRRICTPMRNLLPLPIIDEPKHRRTIEKAIVNSSGSIGSGNLMYSDSKDDNVKTKQHQNINSIQKQSVVNNTQRKAVAPAKPKRNIQSKSSTLEASTSKAATFGERKQNFKDYYNWNVVFPPTTIHENSILYRDTALNNSFRNKWKLVSEKMMTMGSNLGNDFGGSTKELSPRKINNAKLLLEQKHAKSEISLNQIKDEETKAQTSYLLNMIGLPFNWKSRMLMNRNSGRNNNSSSEKTKKRPNLLTNFWRRKRIGDTLTCNKRIQDSDGGFFERFGSILYSQTENNDEKVKETASLASPSVEAAVGRKEIQKAEAVVESRFLADDEGKDSGNESAEAESDSEDKREERFKKLQNALVGMNIEELYEEVLYEIIHNVGSDETKIEPEKMFNFMQEAFKIPEETHTELLERAQTKEPPELRLNIEIIEAKDLNSKDPNGLADPFVTLYIASAPTTRYTSSVKSGTLNPKYEEHFSLPISENPNDDTLVIEVWDFDPAETLGEKMNKFFDVKGAKGFRKLMKEIAATASSGKHDNEFVGSSKVPLKTIPASGLTMWYNLDKKGKTKTQGTIKVRLNFSSEKNDQVASQEHRHLLKILLYNELELSQVAHYWWSGKFSRMAEIIVTQHQAQSGLTDIDVAFAQWSVYTEVHQHHPLSFELFENILDTLIRPIQTKNVSHEEEISLFWEATKRLLPSCFGIIRKLRKKLAGDPNAMKHLIRALNIISKVSMLEPPDQFDLFPEHYYGWLKKDNSSPSWDIRDTINQAVEIGTEEYYESIVDHNELNSDDNDVRLQQLIKIIQLVRSDLQRAIEHHDKVFQESMNYQYAGMIYKVYDRKLMVQVKPIVVDICKTKIERLDLLDRKDMKHNRYEEINMLTTLFELYLLLKRFTVLGTALCPGVTEFEMSDYYEWFSDGVAHWLDISLYKALTRIKRAIELDNLIAVDATVKYSSSAVDTLAIFYQIRIFWQQLAWPNAEGAFIFVSKIVDDICKCCTFYGDTMAERVDKLGMIETVYERKFEVTTEWCLAINNIDYIRQSIHSFVKEMGVDDIIRNMSDYRGPLDAQRCSDTLQNVIENAIDTGKNKIYELTGKLAFKMNPAMRRFLVEGAELFDTDSNAMDRLMMYMEDSLKTLHSELNEDNFLRMLDAIWIELADILQDLVYSSLEKRRPPSFYSNLRATLQLLIENFNCQSNEQSQSTDRVRLQKIDRLLEIHGYETADLIHQYYKDRYTMQRHMSDTPYGILTVQCYFQRNALEIEVMNAKHLVPMDSDGNCDPFVRIHFYPEDKFLSIAQPKTKVHQKTLFPLFDEKFSITLNDDQRKMDEAIILFSVKDHDYFGMANQYVAEAFLMFKDIADITGDSGSIKQLHLTLTRPQNDDMETVKALQYRAGDKLAKEFLKKLKTKMSDTQAK